MKKKLHICIETKINNIMNTENQETLMWWGYKHTSGTLQAKRFFDQRDLDEAQESPFVNQLVYPFAAKNRDEALAYIENKTK